MPPAKSRRVPGSLTAKGEQTRQRIVAAAADLMFDSSVSGTTIEDVRSPPR
jgi:TetR/AcrR family transcriptional regulator, transcriptional repressor for nem operon